jgi:two-component system phosphate regulon sensor histidine kinase PhoR
MMRTMARGARLAFARAHSPKAGVAIFGSQLMIATAELIVIVAIIIFAPGSLGEPVLFGGIGSLFVLVGVAALVPWDRVPRRARAVLPLLNILAVGLIRAAEPQLGAGLLLVFPIIWLAQSFAAAEVVAGVGFAIVVVWAGRAFDGGPLVPNDFAALVLLPVVLGFIAASVFLAARRTRAQTVLLRQHSLLIESSLERMTQQRRLLNEVLNSLAFGVLVFNRDKQVVLVNRTYRRWLDEFGEAKHSTLFSAVYQPDRVSAFAYDDRPFFRAVNGQELDNVVIWAGEPGARRAAYSITSRMFTDVGDSEYAGMIVLKDVTQELDAIRGRDDLVGSVTHELRSPLTSILGYLDLISDADMSSETRRHVEIATDNAERLLVIVNDLLRAASDADKSLPMSFVPADVVAIARESLTSHAAFAQQYEVDLELDAPDAVHATVDPVRIRQVLDNLVTNAIKYNREWGDVLVRVEEQGGKVEIEVRDSGQGIPDTDLPRIFDRFYRTKSARNSATTGTGLGLAITREIVERHGGELSVESVYGLGSTFRLTIPSEHRSGRPGRERT